MKVSMTLIKRMALLGVFLLSACGTQEQQAQQKPDGDSKLNVVTTTTMINDLVTIIGGGLIDVQGLMGSGVDPHLYKASEGDLQKLNNADVIFYNGLHLEGKLAELFENMSHQNRSVFAIADGIDQAQFISSENFPGNYDPHIWFDTSNWRAAASYVAKKLSEIVPDQASEFDENLQAYLSQLDSLDNDITTVINQLSQERRILVTAHDAFNYFGRQHSFEVRGLMGISTSSEAGVKEVQNLAQYIVDKKIKAIFIESSVPVRNIEALQAAVNAKGFDVAIGGELFSDALGDLDSSEGNYIGMVKHNVTTIINALK